MALGACSSQVEAPASPLPTAVATIIPAATSTVPPSPTAYVSPTPVPTEGIPEADDPGIHSQVDSLAAHFLAQGTNSALGVAIVKRDPQTGQLTAMMLDYGKTSKVKGKPVTPDTVYEIGSITKIFTGILLAQEIESGVIQLGDPLQGYLPEGIEAPSYNGKQITLTDLVTHRSGLPRDIDTDNVSGMYSWLNHYVLTRAPGDEYEYSNVGYALLGDILVRMTGTGFNALEYQSVSQPLGLADTVEQLNADQSSRLAHGYTYDGSPAQYMPDSGAYSSAGYMRSTLKDMTRFLMDNMQPGSTLLSDSIAMAQQMQGEGKDADSGGGLGWDISHPGDSNERLYKGGTTYAFTSYISFMQDGTTGFVLLTNGMYADTLVPRMLGMLNMAP